METNNRIDIAEIIAAILIQCADTELKNGFTKGWYVSRIKDGFDKLSYTTFWYEDTIDIQNFDPKNTGSYLLPENIFNVREAYLFKGECCTLQDSVIIHLKKRFNNKNGETTGTYTSFRNDSRKTWDAFYGKDNIESWQWDKSRICYGNIQNGHLMINTVKFKEYPHLRLVFNGTKEGDLTEDKIVPRFFKEYLIDFVCSIYFKALAAKERNVTLLNFAKTYENSMNDPRDGSRIVAERLVKDMHSFQEADQNQYMQKGNTAGY